MIPYDHVSKWNTALHANDIGILFNRGNQGNAAFFYDESAKTFKLSDTKDPKSNTSLSPVTASNSKCRHSRRSYC